MQSQPSVSVRRLRTLGIVALLGGLAVAVPIAIALRYGALGIPRSDDWSYLLTLFRFVDTGHLQFNNWVSMTLLGQIVLAAPIVLVTGHEISAIQVLTALLGLAGLLAVVALGRRLVVPLWWGAFVAATIAAGPLWGPLAVSYMTDVPAFAFTMLGLLIGVEGMRRRPVPLGWIAASMAVGLVAFTIRQYAFVSVLATALTAAWWYASQHDRRRLRNLGLLTVAAVVLAFAFLLFWHSIPDAKALSPGLPDSHSVKATGIKGAGFLRLAGLLLSPVLVLAGPIRTVRRAWAAGRVLTTLTVLGLLVWLAGTAYRVPRVPFVGNYLSPDGVLSRDVLLGHRPDVFGPGVFGALVLIGSVGGLLLGLAAVPGLVAFGHRMRTRAFGDGDPLTVLLVLTVAGYAAAYALALISGLQAYDRYLLPVLAPIAFLVLRTTVPATAPAATEPSPDPRARGRVALAVMAISLLGLVGLAFTIDSASFDGARWRVALAATQRGWSSRQVNGGFEWLNYHRGVKRVRPGPGSNPRRGANGPPSSPLRVSLFCVNVVIDPTRPLPGRVIAVGHSRAPTRKPALVLAVRTNRPCFPHGRVPRKR